METESVTERTFAVNPDFMLEIPGPAGGLPVELAPDVWLYRNAISPELCDRIIAKFDADPRKSRRGGTPDGPSFAYRVADMLHMTTLEDWKAEDAAFHEEFRKVTYHHYMSLRYPPSQMHYFEDTGYDITCYRPPADHCAIHCDGGMDHRRVTSFVAYLNDVEQGGETFFPRWNLDVKPEKGAVVVFPPHYTHFHGAKPPISGPRYIVLTWMVWAKKPEVFPGRGD